MIQRAIIHVDGPPGVGKTTFVERLLHATDQEILAARCHRDDSLRHLQAASPMTNRELRRYREAGAIGAAMLAFPADVVVDEFFMTGLMQEYSQAVVIEGDSPVAAVDLRVYVAPPLGPDRALLVRKLRDRAEEEREKAAAMRRALREPDGVERFLEQMIGGAVVDFARQRPALLEAARATLLAGVDSARNASPPTPTEHWAIVQGYEGIEHAQLVVVNVRDHGQRECALELLADLTRLRKDKQVFDDVLGWRGTRIPITAVIAELSDQRDPGTRKAVARVKRTVRSVFEP